MCGIAGIIHRDGATGVGSEMTAMLLSLRHRGPDSTGFAVYGPSAKDEYVMRLKLAEKDYEIGEYYYRRKFWDSAVMYWDKVEKDFPDTIWAPRALAGIMRAYDKIGYQDLVQETRQRILDKYPNSPEAREVTTGGATPPARAGGAG